MYTVLTTHQSYHVLPDEEIEGKFRDAIFPTIDYLPAGSVILKCWNGNV